MGERVNWGKESERENEGDDEEWKEGVQGMEDREEGNREKEGNEGDKRTRGEGVSNSEKE